MEVNSTIHHTLRSTEGLSVEVGVLRPTNFELPDRHVRVAYRQTSCVGTSGQHSIIKSNLSWIRRRGA